MNQQGISGRFQFGSRSLPRDTEEVLKSHFMDLFDSSLANSKQLPGLGLQSQVQQSLGLSLCAVSAWE